MTSSHVILVAKKSAYQRYVEQKQDARAQELLRASDPAVASWMASHEEHERTLGQAKAVLAKLNAKVTVRAASHTPFETKGADLVLTVGGDGTLLSASHNVGLVPVLGVNSSPSFSVGFFCAANASNLEDMLVQALQDRTERVVLTRMQVTLNGDRISNRVLNEALYCHASPAATSRYILEASSISEEQRSSGFWVGPAAGSTGALHSAGGTILPLSAPELQLVVREPYTPAGQRYELLKVIVSQNESIVVRSKMQDGAMFLDGPYKRVAVRLGDVASFATSDEPLTLLGFSKRRHVPSVTGRDFAGTRES
ncbi:MAG: NAD(+)/NADH kinase [Polyangiaceae bacterium]|nr:NAD(+)/NADH kinase [Polyangiaceae bacterium]